MNPDEVKWELGVKCGNSRYTTNTKTMQKCCGLTSSENTLKCADSRNNGWKQGYLSIQGKQYCNESSWFDNPSEIIYTVEFAGTYILF